MTRKVSRKLPHCRALWEAFEVTLKDDPASQTGKTEMLTPINIADTMPSYTTSLLQVPKLAFNYGLHKLVYRVEVRKTDHDEETRSSGVPFLYIPDRHWRPGSSAVQRGLHLLDDRQESFATCSHGRISGKSITMMPIQMYYVAQQKCFFILQDIQRLESVVVPHPGDSFKRPRFSNRDGEKT